MFNSGDQIQNQKNLGLGLAQMDSIFANYLVPTVEAEATHRAQSAGSIDPDQIATHAMARCFSVIIYSVYKSLDIVNVKSRIILLVLSLYQ